MRLGDVMSIEPLTVGTDVSPEAARRLMEEGRVHHLPIVDEGISSGCGWRPAPPIDIRLLAA